MAFIKTLRGLLGFTRRETYGFLILLSLIILFCLSIPVYNYVYPPDDISAANDQASLDSMLQWLEHKQVEQQRSGEVTSRRFPFNPATASERELRDLGFSPSMVQRILRFRAKGGTFRIKRDLLKIYGMDSVFYSSIEEFIDLPDALEQPAVLRPAAPLVTELDINEADTTMLKTINGIGTVRARRIVRFRERLGGFVSIDQVKEVYGLDSTSWLAVQERCRVQADFKPVKIRINEANELQLSAHPYISKTVARLIVAYRQQHGPYAGPEDLGKIRLPDPAIIRKISPYLAFD